MTDKHTQQLKQKLNKIYFEREEQIDLIIDGFTKQENLWLYGPTGTAKSKLFNEMAEALGYSVYHIDRQTSYWLLEGYDEKKNTPQLGIDANTPTILFINHPYLWHKSPDLIKAVVDLQRSKPDSFPFSFIVAESLWEVTNEKTNWLTDYFPKQIEFKDIQNPENRLKAL